MSRSSKHCGDKGTCGVPYLGGVEGVVGDLEDEVGPDGVEDEKDGEQDVEDVVGGEHLNHLRSLDRCTEHG